MTAYDTTVLAGAPVAAGYLTKPIREASSRWRAELGARLIQLQDERVSREALIAALRYALSARA